MATKPTLAEVRAYVKVPATHLSDEDLQRIYDACTEDQDARCLIPEDPAAFPSALSQAFLRRVQREVAARNLPLGMVGIDTGEFGPTRLTSLDVLVEEHERRYRKQVLA
jgi:hypothetical protein